MLLTLHQKTTVEKTWQMYQEFNHSQIITPGDYRLSDLDKIRLDNISLIQEMIQLYLENKMSIKKFKTKLDGQNKQYPLWGFKGVNGQMFFNMLFNTCDQTGNLGQLDQLLRNTIQSKSSIQMACENIEELEIFIDELPIENPRSRPKKGSIPFFLSYFWQIHDYQQFPIYYKSMIDKFQLLNIWEPNGTNAEKYESFFELNHAILRFLKSQYHDVGLWDIEHAFYYQVIQAQSRENDVTISQPVRDQVILPSPQELPGSYIPPIVSILPHLAKHDLILEEACINMGTSIAKVFENRIDIVFNMLGYETEALGQGYGRVPDGIVICREFHYALIYDAKVSRDGYTIGRDVRAIREYISNASSSLQRQGINKLYFLIISSKFTNNNDDVIRNLKMETDIREVLLVEADVLLSMLEMKLRDSSLDLGTDGLQRIFTQSGVLDTQAFTEFWGN